MNYDALERLVRLRNQGALTDKEFTEQKLILINENTEELTPSQQTLRRVHSISTLQRISAAAFTLGLCTVLYATFIYDTTISPMDAASSYSSVDASSSIQDRASALSEVSNRFERTVAGERIINFPRIETQRRIFWFGALLTILGAVGFLIPIAREQRR